jgi:hypothetical protein
MAATPSRRYPANGRLQNPVRYPNGRTFRSNRQLQRTLATVFPLVVGRIVRQRRTVQRKGGEVMKSTVGSIIVAALVVAGLITWQAEGGWMIWVPVVAGLAIGWSVGKTLIR